jgi:hypothetical protein
MRWQLVLHDIRALKLDLARLDPRAGMPVLPPAGATPAAIAAAERRLGRALPPSYCALLESHDGVPQIYHGASLLGARPLARGTYVDLCRMVIEVQGEADLVPFGIDTKGETIFAWDRRVERADGELGVVMWVNEIGERVESFPDFLELLRSMLAAEIEDRIRASGSPRSRARLADGWLRFAAA